MDFGVEGNFNFANLIIISEMILEMLSHLWGEAIS